MFEPDPSDLLDIPPEDPPQLIVTVDTEAEFDWDQPYSRSNNKVDSVYEQYRAQEIFDRHGVVPTYLVDYAVASSDAAIETLRAFHEAGRCEIGAHLNPWLTPPFEEPVDAFHSYPCNLPDGLERRKLECLTSAIADRFGTRPRTYRAGRYGIGPQSGRILEELGYRVDMSVVPYTSFAADGGPDFRRVDHRPYRCGPKRTLLEIPVSCGYVGSLAAIGQHVFPVISSPLGMSLHLPGGFARIAALERIRLTPEGHTLRELRRLTNSLYRSGCRIFSFTYHSPSVVPRNTPYVRDDMEREKFLQVISNYCQYFIDELGGIAATATELVCKLEGQDNKNDGVKRQHKRPIQSL